MPRIRLLLPLCWAVLPFLNPISYSFAQTAPEHYNQSRFNQAIRHYRLMADSGDLRGYLNLAVILKDLGHYSQGIGVLEKARMRYPDDQSVLTFLARLYFLNGEPQKAADLLQGPVRNNPAGTEALLLLGLCYDTMGRQADAGAYLRRALEVDPNNIIAHLTLADIYYRSDKLRESEEEYKAVNLLDASIRHIYSYWGAVLVKLGNFREAYRIYEKMRSFDPSDPVTLAQLELVRKKLGETFFAREKEKRLAGKERKRILVQPARVSEEVVKVRVGLVDSARQVELMVSTGYSIRTKQGNFLINRGSAGQVCSVSTAPGNKLICQLSGAGRIVVDEPVFFIPESGRGTCTVFDIQAAKDEFWHRQEDRSYRGTLEVSAHGSAIRVVNVLSLEEYLYSVVPSEMISSWPFEALKAQAVAARSEALHKIGRHKADGYDFCPEVHCQAYSGVERETAATNLAVDETRGMVLSFAGKPIDAVYSSCCGGHTQDNIFGKEPRSVEYFQGVPDMASANGLTFPLDPVGLEQWLKDPPEGIMCNIPEFARSSNFRWVRVYSSSEMDALASKLGDIGKVSKIVVVRRNASGHISSLKLVGSRSSYLIEKELNIRKALGDLRSSMFKVEIRYDQDRNPLQFVFYGGGWGHGVGMCQAGACGMATRGKSFKDILAHYFKRAELKKMY